MEQTQGNETPTSVDTTQREGRVDPSAHPAERARASRHPNLSRLDMRPHKLIHHLDELQKWKRGEYFVPVYVELSPIDICNQKCHFCYTDYLGHQKHLAIPRDLLLRIFRDMGAAGVKSVQVQGTGEPLLNSATPDAILVGKHSGLDISLGTNGHPFTEETLEKVAPALSWMRFSALEVNARQYARTHVCPENHFARVINNLKLAVAIRNRDNLDLVIGAHFLSFPYNVETVCDLTRFCKEEIGIDYLLLKTPNLGLNIPNKQWPRNTFYRYRRLFEKAASYQDDSFKVSVRWDQAALQQADGAFKKTYKSCYGMLFETMVDADSKVYPCLNFWRDSRYALGDLRDMSFAELWSSDRCRDVLRHLWLTYDLERCHFGCKQHHINETLWNLANPPLHVNFL